MDTKSERVTRSPDQNNIGKRTDNTQLLSSLFGELIEIGIALLEQDFHVI